MRCTLRALGWSRTPKRWAIRRASGVPTSDAANATMKTMRYARAYGISDSSRSQACRSDQEATRRQPGCVIRPSPVVTDGSPVSPSG